MIILALPKALPILMNNTEPISEKTNRLHEKILEYGIIIVFICASLAYALMTPAYEGFDETAHYSYISYLAKTEHIPDFRSTKLDANVENDQKIIPKPYKTFPPYQDNGGFTYYRFFNSASHEDQTAAYQKLWFRGTEGIGYQEGKALNWEGQHPPLYYITMLLPYHLSKNWPAGYKIIFLRICSLAMVWIGLFIWIRAVRRFSSPESRLFFLSGAAVLLFFPSFYFEFARIGNDSLTALLVVLCFYFILRIHQDKTADYKPIIHLSIIIGLGLLTKMFFVPIAAGCIAFVIFTAYKNYLKLYQIMTCLLILILIPFVISGSWFNFFHERYGMYLGGTDFYASEHGGAVSIHLSSAGYLIELGRIAASFIKTFLWCGTWSLLKLPYWYYLVFVPIAFIIIYNMRHEWKNTRDDVRQMIIAASSVTLILLAGFGYHAVTKIASTGRGAGTPGHYLYIVWPFLTAIFPYALVNTKKRALIILTFLSFGILILFEMEGVWRNMLIYGGILQKTGTDAFGVGYAAPTLNNIRLAMARNDQLTFILPGLTLFFTAIAMKSVLLIFAKRTLDKILLSLDRAI